MEAKLRKIILDSLNARETSKTFINAMPLGDEDKLPMLLQEVINENFTTLEGPAGTGKTVLIARLIVQLISMGKKIALLSSYANSLSEVIDKEYLKSYRDGQIITLCTNNNVINTQLKGLNSIGVDSFLSSDHQVTIADIGDLLPVYKDTKYVKPCFDLIIIDEAARLSYVESTALAYMSRSMLWVGDSCQLSHSSDINSFSDLCQNPNISHYILTITYRLNKRTAEFTSIFYTRKLISCSKYESTPTYCIDTLSQELGPVLVYYRDDLRDIVDEYTCKMFLVNPYLEIVILANSNSSLDIIKRTLHGIRHYHNLIFSSVKGSQGLSVDIVFFVLIDLDDDKVLTKSIVNVATTRSKQHTIILYPKGKELKPKDPKVAKYFALLNSNLL